MKRNRFFALLFILVLLASQALDAQSEWQQIAQSHVPPGAVYQRMERDDGLQVLIYTTADGAESYEVKINPETSAVVKVESERRNDRGSRQAVLTDQQAVEGVLAAYPGAALQYVQLQRDDGLYEYEVVFTTSEFTGKVQVNAENGQVLERELNYLAPAGASGPITADQAKALVQEKLPGCTIRDFETDRDDGRTVYEGEAVLDRASYEFKIDAEAGSFLEWEQDD